MKNLQLALKTALLFLPLALLALSPLWLCIMYFKNKTFLIVNNNTYGGIMALALLITLLITLLIVVIYKIKKVRAG